MSDNAATSGVVPPLHMVSKVVARQVPGKEIEEESPNSTTVSTQQQDDADSLLGRSDIAHIHPAREVAGSSSSNETTSTSEAPRLKPPSIHKRNLKKKPRGILKPAPPPTKAFSFRRDILQQLNTRLAQQGVNVQVPVPQGPSALGSLTETAQGTAQAAGSILGGMFKKMSGFASAPTHEDQSHTATGVGRVTSTSRSATQHDGEHEEGREQAHGSTLSSSMGRESQQASNSSTITNNLPAPSSSIRPLRKVRFTVSSMTVTYPISNTIAPGDEDATRIRIEREHREKLRSKGPKDWTVSELESLYRECCRTREEHPLKKMRSVFLEAKQETPPGLRTIDLSFILLDRQAIEPVADLLSVDFGLNKLVLENCGLTDDGIKSILHSLLVSGSLPSLSLAANKKIKYHGWRFVGIFMRRAKALKYLDLSENSINKASLEHIAGAIAKQRSTSKQPPESNQGPAEEEKEEPLTIKAELLNEDTKDISSLASLRLENCGLRTNSLEVLAQSVRFSDLNHLSLRRNKIGQIGAVALAIMLKDYPDATSSSTRDSLAVSKLEQVQQQHATKQQSASPSHSAPILRSGRSLSPALPQVPFVVSSPGGGVTRRSMPIIEGYSSNGTLSTSSGTAGVTSTGLDSPALDFERTLTDEEREQVKHLKVNERRTEEEAMALFHARRAKRILSTLPRVGSLLTLDLKGNDIRGGVVYLSQALKKNRTLKVLNLSDNNIEMSGLVAIADALKYNATLETLDLSHNPCCGPGLEGITTLRNAFTLNSNLKRLFISDTDLSSEGAIALAEFLPEAKSLIHLDLTENLQIDIAGVMALAVSVRMNKSLRCLDLNIPPNAPDFARLSQEILNSCIRNTENAQRKAQQRGVKAPIAAPIYKSTLARAAKEKEEKNKLMEANSRLEESAALEAEKNKEKVVEAAQECCRVLQELLYRERDAMKELAKERGPRNDTLVQSELSRDLLTQGKILKNKLQKALSVIHEGEQLSRALQINDDMESAISTLEGLYAATTIDIHIDDEVASSKTKVNEVPVDKNHLKPPSVIESGLSSPTFSIGSDDEDDEEEEENSSLNEVKKLSSKKSLERLQTGLEEASASGQEEQQAAREIPNEKEVIEESTSGNHQVNHKARGQLSEEGEIFRRARSLQIEGEEDEEEDEGLKKSEEATTFENEDPSQRNKEGSKEGASTSQRSHDRAGSTSKVETDVSGEDLRKELLESDVPRNPPSSNVITGEDGERKAEEVHAVR
ncbi:hypothetical protein CBS101457_006278 [Exobasidium rhododendri]|nr:hypothetical protein CBS101457_006278 [Exobasidium rhododendri]